VLGGCQKCASAQRSISVGTSKIGMAAAESEAMCVCVCMGEGVRVCSVFGWVFSQCSVQRMCSLVADIRNVNQSLFDFETPI